MKYTYHTYPAHYQAAEGDKQGARVETAMRNFGYENEECYVLCEDGRMTEIQSASCCPYPGVTIEESAQNHIAEIEGAQEG